MKAHEPQDFIAICEKRKEEAFKSLQTALIAAEEQKRFAPTLRRLSFFYDCTLWAFASGTTHFDVQVKDMKEVEPALRLMEEELGVEFAGTEDYAAAGYAQRKFTTKCGKIVINASVHGDEPTCRSVVVGEETVVQKKYKLVCDDEPDWVTTLDKKPDDEVA